MGTSVYPKFLCPPCAASRRGLLSQGKADNATKATLTVMERDYPEKMKETIRCGRVKPHGEDIRIPGVNCVGDGKIARVGILGTLTQRTVANTGVRIEQAHMSIPKQTFIAQQMMNWESNANQAHAIWESKIHALGLSPDAPGSEDICVPFVKPGERVGVCQRMSETGIEGQNIALYDDKDLRMAVKAVEPSDIAQEFRRNFADLGGDIIANSMYTMPAMASVSDIVIRQSIKPPAPTAIEAGPGQGQGAGVQQVRRDGEDNDQFRVQRPINIYIYMIVILFLLIASVVACSVKLILQDISAIIEWGTPDLALRWARGSTHTPHRTCFSKLNNTRSQRYLCQRII